MRSVCVVVDPPCFDDLTHLVKVGEQVLVVLTHANAQRNDQSIGIIRPFVRPLPVAGDKLIVGVPMLFRYRKAMRTFLNETQP